MAGPHTQSAYTKRLMDQRDGRGPRVYIAVHHPGPHNQAPGDSTDGRCWTIQTNFGPLCAQTSEANARALYAQARERAYRQNESGWGDWVDPPHIWDGDTSNFMEPQ